jgi:hypothetical protein
MFEQVFESLRTMTEANIHMQQEMLKKWAGMWAGVPKPGGGDEQILKAQNTWAECMTEAARKQRETLEAQFSVGLKNIEEAFRLAEVKDPEVLRARTVELWQKSFDCVRQVYEAQMRDLQAAMAKWTELVTKGAA